MLIPIINDYYKRGYLSAMKDPHRIVFFPNCNMAVRREAITDVGGYDEALLAAEDVDICKRAILHGWRLYFEPDACCRHAARISIRALIHQWYTYGSAFATVLGKFSDHRCSFYFSSSAAPKIFRYRSLLRFEFRPFPVTVFLSYFPLLNVMGFLIVLALVMGWSNAAMFGGVIASGWLIALLRMHPVASRIKGKDLLLFLFIHYCINASCSAGSLIGGFRSRMLCLFPGV